MPEVLVHARKSFTISEENNITMENITFGLLDGRFSPLHFHGIPVHEQARFFEASDPISAQQCLADRLNCPAGRRETACIVTSGHGLR